MLVTSLLLLWCRYSELSELFLFVLENAGTVYVRISMSGHHDMGFKTVMFLLSLQGAALL